MLRRPRWLLAAIIASCAVGGVALAGCSSTGLTDERQIADSLARLAASKVACADTVMRPHPAGLCFAAAVEQPLEDFVAVELTDAQLRGLKEVDAYPRQYTVVIRFRPDSE